MVGWIANRRCSPIGIDIGSRSVKLLQFDAGRTRVRAAARWDLPLEDEAKSRDARIVDAIRQARQQRDFRGRDAIMCLGSGRLFVQNVRVAPAPGEEIEKLVYVEAAGRLPFNREEAEIHYVEAADVHQSDKIRREVIVLACHRPVLDKMLSLAEEAGLRPSSVDIEPAAMLRSYNRQFRRDDDQNRRLVLVHVGASNTLVVIARGDKAMFIKYIDIGGNQLDAAVACHLHMPLAEATALRRHNGDRRADQRDPEVTRGIVESVRPVLDRLVTEISLCLRYYSVTFRGQPISQIVLGGGEATEALAEWLGTRLNLPCELGDPLRSFEKSGTTGRVGQWDVAAGLALRE